MLSLILRSVCCAGRGLTVLVRHEPTAIQHVMATGGMHGLIANLESSHPADHTLR